MLFDLANFLTVVVLIIFANSLRMIPFNLALILTISAATPFLLNDVLFPAAYMPDQFKYYEVTHSIRNLSFDYTSPAKTVELASWMFSLLPLPFTETINSIGFFNRFLATSLIIWLYHYHKLRGLPLYFILSYPSFLLYTSLSLRDALIFSFMLISIILFIKNYRIASVIISLPLFILKFQNFFLMIIFYLIYPILTKGTKLYKYRVLAMPLVAIIGTATLLYASETLNYYRFAMYLEDGGEKNTYIPITGITDVISLSTISFLNFLLRPFIWESNGPLQLIQSFENILIFIFLIFYYKKSYAIDNFITVKWGIILFIFLTVYGLVVFNFGTASRYKFPLLALNIIGLGYDLLRNHGSKGLLK